MGKIVSKLNGKKELRLLMVGLDSAGKTTILYHLKMRDTLHTIPTLGFNVESIDYKNVTLNLWDVGGQVTLRSLWRHYYTGTQGIIFVVDCSDSDRVEAARDELRKVVNDREMRDCSCILVYANKQDMKGAIKATEIPEMLGLDQLTNHHWQVQPSCAKTGDGLYMGLDWLIANAVQADKDLRKRSKIPERELKSSGWTVPNTVV